MSFFAIWDKVPIPYKRMTQRSKYLPANQAYLACKNDLALCLKESNPGMTYQGEVSVSVAIIRPKKTGDVDNYLKLVLDALQESGIIKNDNQVTATSAIIIDPKNLIEAKSRLRVCFHPFQGANSYWDKFLKLKAGLMIHVAPISVL